MVIRWKDTTGSTNADARSGVHGDVFAADYQTAGRGRLDHRWESARGLNLMFSAVFDVSGVMPQDVATFPLVVGLSIAETVEDVCPDLAGHLAVKWPNDVLADGRKLAGILCERNGDCVIAGVGLNVNQRDFPEEIAGRVADALAFREGPDKRIWTRRILRIAVAALILGKPLADAMQIAATNVLNAIRATMDDPATALFLVLCSCRTVPESA